MFFGEIYCCYPYHFWERFTFMKRSIALILCIITALTSFVSCSQKKESSKNVLKVAVLDSAYGSRMWEDVCDAYQKLHKNIEIELTAEKNLEDVIGAKMKAGDYPDFVLLALGRESALTETLIKGNAIEPISDVLEMTVPGEDQKVSDKLLPGFVSTLATNPYKNGQTYLAPMFYSPCGLFYNAGLFKEKGWSVPTTIEEFFALGDLAKKEGISLFTYPTAGYFDSFIYSLLAESGGAEFFNSCMRYEEGIWDTPEAERVLEIVERLADYTEPTTVANANSDNFLKNQQLILDNKALFMPNGSWVVEEMSSAPRADGFEWGFCPLPAIEDDRYSYTFFEQGWIPKEAKNKDEAKKFLAYLYSDEAAEIFASSGAVQPIKSSLDYVEGDAKLFYSVYDDGALAVMGGFAATESIEGVSMADTLFNSVNSIISKDKTAAEWKQEIISTSDKLRKVLK